MFEGRFQLLLFCACIALVLTWPAAGVLAEPPPELLQARGKYAAQLKRFADEAKSHKNDKARAYLNDLRVLERGAQAAGDLDLLLAVQTETKRFALSGGELRGEAPVPASIEAARDAHAARTRDIDEERLEQSRTLRAQYVAYLERQIRTYTIAGAVEIAVAYRDERDGLETVALPAAAAGPAEGSAPETKRLRAKAVADVFDQSRMRGNELVGEGRVRLCGRFHQASRVAAGHLLDIDEGRVRVIFSKATEQELAELERARRANAKTRMRGAQKTFGGGGSRKIERRNRDDGERVFVFCEAAYTRLADGAVVFTEGSGFTWILHKRTWDPTTYVADQDARD